MLGFLRELDLGTTKSAADAGATVRGSGGSYYNKNGDADLAGKISYVWEPNRLSNLVFLSARPHVYSDLSEQLTYGG